MFQNLINTALLGTDKMDFDVRLLPQSVQTIVATMPEADKEARFLKTAALMAFYEEAGCLPKRFLGELPTDKPTQELPITTEKFAKILPTILEVQYYFRNDLLELWLDKLIENQQIVSAKTVVLLLGLVEGLPKKFRPKILKVIGSKGLNLLAYKTDISQWQILPDEQIWTEGRLAERRDFFTNLRKENPQKALELQQSTWSQESLSDKMAFLEVLKNTFQSTDVSFLENILPEFQYKNKERKTQKDCRNLVMGLLVGQPHTTAYSRTNEALTAYIVSEKAKGVLGWVGKENKALDLPKEEDSFLNINTMMADYGFEASPDAAIFVSNQLYWLSCFVAILPFDFWETQLQKNTENTLIYLTGDGFWVKIGGKKQAILLHALIANALQLKNTALANAIIKITVEQEHWQLLQILSQTEQENYLIENNQLTNQQAIEACFGDWKGTWSAHFSTKILQECYNVIITKSTYLPDRLGAMLAQFLHPSSINFLETANVYPPTANNYHINHWQNFFVDAIQKTFEIKQQIR
jgi:Family of unknown function (DUF5691)